MDKTKNPRDLYQEATDKIIKALEAGTMPWQKPWDNVSTGPLRNGASGNPYHGINTLMLFCSSMEKGYTDPRFLSFKQCQQNGWKVKKGAKSERVFFYKPMSVDVRDSTTGQPVIDAATGQSMQRQIPFLQATPVFNAQDIEGIPPLGPGDAKFSPIEAGETIVARCPVEIRHGGNSAHYNPTSDTIAMPEKDQFKSPEAYYATLAHETIHSTGHPTRCNREFGKRFGSDSYSMEEMTAELGSLMLSNETGLPAQVENHASYIEHWLKVLKSDKKAIFIASAKASQAVDYVMGRPAYDAKADARSEVKAEAPKPEAVKSQKPELPADLAVPTSDALAAVSAKMKSFREKRAPKAPPPAPNKMGM